MSPCNAKARKALYRYCNEAEGVLDPCHSIATQLASVLTTLSCYPELTVFTQTFFLIFPLMWHSLFVPSIHMASSLPLPSMRNTCAYSVSNAVSLVP